ncbi:MAG: PQQ-binding-like beta-propeller repeat protein, partial [Candidatus Aenigmarchaeota archaeon]|nr:PQQ-binding-like beta-propeller repeat protein [Candidatus Aenigmarchaeota archaeon]
MERYLAAADVRASASIASEFGDLQFLEVYALLTQTRSYPLWDITTGGTIWGIPLVVGDRIYVGACDHHVYCLSLDGREIWRFQTQGPVNIVTAPAYADGIVYATSYDHKVYALDAATGQLQWAFATRDKVCAEPLVREGRVYVGSKDGSFYCLDARTGELRWKVGTRAPISSSAAWWEGRVYVGGWDGLLYCFLPDGRLAWKFPTKDLIAKKIAVGGGVAYAVSRDGSLYAVDALTGQRKWVFRQRDSLPCSAPVLDKDMVFFAATFQQRLFALRTADGSVAWSFPLTNLEYGQPTCEGEMVYMTANDGWVYALDRASGKVRWKYAEPLRADWADGNAIAGGRMYIGSRNCKLVCLSLQGEKIWEFTTSLSEPSSITFEQERISPEGVFTVVQEAAPEQERYRVQTLVEGGSDSVYSFKTEYSSKS